MSKRSELINKVRAILQPSRIYMMQIDDGPVTYNNKVISEAQLKIYEKRNEVTIFHIIPVSRRFKTV